MRVPATTDTWLTGAWEFAFAVRAGLRRLAQLQDAGEVAMEQGVDALAVGPRCRHRLLFLPLARGARIARGLVHLLQEPMPQLGA